MKGLVKNVIQNVIGKMYYESDVHRRRVKHPTDYMRKKKYITFISFAFEPLNHWKHNTKSN